MRAFNSEKLKAVAERMIRNLRDHLEWSDGERVASIDEIKPGEPLSARLNLKDDHLQDIQHGEGYEWLGKRLAFKMIPELRKRLNGYRVDPEKIASQPASASDNGYLEADWNDSPFKIRLRSRECRWRDESGYQRGAGELLAELVVNKDAPESGNKGDLPRLERAPRPFAPIVQIIR